MNLDALSQFLEATWRGIPFPTANFDIAYSHDLAEHKIYGKSVSNEESTGLNSREFSFSIPFRNGVTPGASEFDLSGRVLFPDVYLAFIDAFNDPSSGDLQHPMVGRVNCKSGTIRIHGDADARDGVDVTVTFKESDDTPSGTATPVDTPATVSSIGYDADALDAEIGALDPPLTDDAGVPFTSFSQLGSFLRQPFDTFTMLSTRTANLLNALAGELDRLKESIDTANNVMLWPIQAACVRLQNSVYDLQRSQQTELTKFRRYIVPQDTTLGEICSVLHLPLEDVLRSNPLLAESPVVDAGTAVVYQRAA